MDSNSKNLIHKSVAIVHRESQTPEFVSDFPTETWVPNWEGTRSEAK